MLWRDMQDGYIEKEKIRRVYGEHLWCTYACILSGSQHSRHFCPLRRHAGQLATHTAYLGGGLNLCDSCRWYLVPRAGARVQDQKG